MTDESFVQKERFHFRRIETLFPEGREREKRSKSTLRFFVNLRSFFAAGNAVFEKAGSHDDFEESVGDAANAVDGVAGEEPTVAVECTRA